MIKYRHLFIYLIVFFLVWLVGGMSYNWSIPPLAGIFNETKGLENVFTPVSALFSGLASGGAIIAILLQVRIIGVQQFDTNFHNMLAIHQNNKNSISYCQLDQSNDTKDVSGLDAFKALHQKLEAITTYAYADLTPKHEQYITRTLKKEIEYATQNAPTDEEIFKLLYATFQESTDYCLSHYFRHLYHIFKFIDENVAGEKDRRKFFSIARAQLSPYEYSLFYYNGLASDDCAEGEDNSKIKTLINNNCLLHNITDQLLFDGEHAGRYSDSAKYHDR